MIAAVLAVLVTGAPLTTPCTGQRWVELASDTYQDARLGPVLAIYNRQAGTEACKPPRTVRLIGVVKHRVRLGQSIKGIAGRFLRGADGQAFLRKLNNLPAGEPASGRELSIPTELTLKLTSRPKEEFEALAGLPPLAEVLAYNRTKRLKSNTTIFVPLLWQPQLAPKGMADAGVADAPPVDAAPADAAPADVERVQSQSPPDAGLANEAGTSAAAEKPTEVPLDQAQAIDALRALLVPVSARSADFEHMQHQSLMQDGFRCVMCHATDANQKFLVSPVPEAVCSKCHPNAQLEGRRTHELSLLFSHAGHLQPDGPTRKEGYEPTCDTCHAALEDGVKRQEPGHAVCVECHNPSEVQPTMTECAGCHEGQESGDPRLTALARLSEHFMKSDRGTDLIFTHKPHVVDESQQACLGCHVEADKADNREDLKTPRMAGCLECHRGLEKQDQNLGRGAACHVTTKTRPAPNAARVIDHQLIHGAGFRRRHKQAALADDGVCATCHFELAGAPGSSCDRCHQTTRPRDHAASWRERPHGRAAVRDPERCATCHQTDRCTDCHAVAPRSHAPRAVFLRRHGRQARASTRNCLTCHRPEIDCARCHDLTR